MAQVNGRVGGGVKYVKSCVTSFMNAHLSFIEFDLKEETKMCNSRFSEFEMYEKEDSGEEEADTAHHDVGNSLIQFFTKKCF